MKLKKSPFPYVFVLIGLISVSIYSNISVNEKIEKPLEYQIDYTVVVESEKSQEIAQNNK